MFKRYLLAVDGSKDSDKVVEWAKDAYNQLPEAQFTFIYVEVPISPEVMIAGGYVPETFYALKEGREHNPAQEAWSRLGENERVRHIKREGNPADEICKEASTGNYDVIVLGSKGHGLVSSVLLGSVSAKVLHRSPIPVLVIR